MMCPTTIAFIIFLVLWMLEHEQKTHILMSAVESQGRNLFTLIVKNKPCSKGTWWWMLLDWQLDMLLHWWFLWLGRLYHWAGGQLSCREPVMRMWEKKYYWMVSQDGCAAGIPHSFSEQLFYSSSDEPPSTLDCSTHCLAALPWALIILLMFC